MGQMWATRSVDGHLDHRSKGPVYVLHGSTLSSKLVNMYDKQQRNESMWHATGHKPPNEKTPFHYYLTSYFQANFTSNTLAYPGSQMF